MRTTHEIVTGDARTLATVADDSVDLVVTSPPYPMIEMWDDLFTTLDPTIADALPTTTPEPDSDPESASASPTERDRDHRPDAHTAFEKMHATLAPVWDELARVLTPGGIAAINIGDATRSIDDTFQVFPNHAKLITAFRDRGFTQLPSIRWRKPVNSTAKFMGSGMIPPNAYPTLEHEHILLFRAGTDCRSFEPYAERRYEAAYFWEERNHWFSDLWTDIAGDTQSLADVPIPTPADSAFLPDEFTTHTEAATPAADAGTASDSTPDADSPATDSATLRDRSAAFPFRLPYRLISMFSVYGDTVLDPFWGTGTTSLAAMATGRHSIGYEHQPAFQRVFAGALETLPQLATDHVHRRLRQHAEFVTAQREQGDPLPYEADHYPFPVRTKQERQITFYEIDDIQPASTAETDTDAVTTRQQYTVRHEPVVGDAIPADCHCR